jgi:hypothetical protein
METPDRVILLEFNELTPSLLEAFMRDGSLPHFKQFFDESMVYTTDAEESGEQLNPWVQWVTVHSGLSYAEHGVANLDEGHRLTRPRVWDLLSEQGYRVWICGSMNVGYRLPLNGWVLPDPWSGGVRPYPPEAGLDDYYRFVQAQVQEHTKEEVSLDRSDYARFLRFMLSHGLSTRTVVSIVKQLGQEKVSGGSWKRAALLDKLQFDVFRSLYRQIRPHFSTFFLNSTAHMQHAYWRHMDPEPFTLKPSEQERTEYGHAVRFGYREMDRILEGFLNLAEPSTTLILATGLSQQPCLLYEEAGGKHFYRPKNFQKVTAFASITSPHRCSPVMSEEFHVYLTTEEDANAAEEALRSLRVDGRPLMKARREDRLDVFTGASVFDELPANAVLTNGQGRSVPFFELFYQGNTVKSGMHHPDGVLWIRTPSRRHLIQRERVSLRTVAPTILQMFDLEPPAYMRATPLALRGPSIAA